MILPRKILVVPLALLLLAGCAPPAPPPGTADETPVTPPADHAAAPNAPSSPAFAPDVVFVVTGTATADNGAVMDLSLQVHQSQNWNASGSTQQATMTTACAGGLDAGIYEQGLWSFTTIDVEAVLRDGPAWPANRRLFVAPTATYVMLATSGFPADDDEVSSDTLRCRRDKVMDAPGTGSLVMGLNGDSDAVGASGNFTRWANHNYGFVGVRVAGQSAASAGITLSDCTAHVTDLGREFNGDADWWSSRIDDSHCVFASLQEEQNF